MSDRETGNLKFHCDDLNKELNELTGEICDSNLKIETKLKLLIIIKDHYKNYERTTGIEVEQDTNIIEFNKYK